MQLALYFIPVGKSDSWKRHNKLETKLENHNQNKRQTVATSQATVSVHIKYIAIKHCRLRDCGDRLSVATSLPVYDIMHRWGVGGSNLGQTQS